MKLHNKIVKILSGMMIACMCLLPISHVDIHAAEYEVVFKAGSHGTLNGEKEVSYRLSSNDVFPDEPSIAVEEGYVFKGWNKQLPDVGSKVSGKAVYVAKYGVVIDGVTYTVRYVDENRVDIATAKTMLAERGTSITERAKTVPGYTYQQAQQSFTVENDTEILFVYTLTNPEEVIRYETVEQQEVINQVVNGPNTNTQTPANPNAQTTTPNTTPNTEGEEDINENPQPQDDGDQDTQDGEGEKDIEDNETPQGDGSGPNYALLGSITGVLLVIGGFIVYLYLKKHKEEEKQGNA